MVQMVRESAETGCLPNSSDFIKEFEVSRRTVARDLDFLRDEERAPLAYDDARHGFRLTDETYTLPPVRISRKEAFSFGLARKLLAHYEGKARAGQARTWRRNSGFILATHGRWPVYLQGHLGAPMYATGTVWGRTKARTT